MVAITPYNPRPTTPRGMEIVSRVRRSSPHLLRQTSGPVSSITPGLSSVAPVVDSVASELAVVAAEGLEMAPLEGGGSVRSVHPPELETGAAVFGSAALVSFVVEDGVMEGVSSSTLTPPSPVRSLRLEPELVSSSPLPAQGVAGLGSAPPSPLLT